LKQSGWIEKENVRIEVRWGRGDADETRKHVSELVALAPDVIVGSGGSSAGALLQATRTVPIVFTQTPDPVGAGFVTSLASPGGNATGFSAFEYGIATQWLEMLKKAAPNVARVTVLRDPTLAQGIGQFGAIQSMAASLGVEVSPANIHDGPEIVRTITGESRFQNTGLIVAPSGLTLSHRDLIVKLAAQYRLPAVYASRAFVRIGGLISYGIDAIDPHRRAAGYVDRILKGEKPADMPVQGPIKYELLINLKTANALGLTIPPSLLARADEVIE
jgi:putative ABC transport system substrate-binding protein